MNPATFAAIHIVMITFLVFAFGSPVTAQDAIAPSPEMDTGAAFALPVSGILVVSSVIISLSRALWW